MELVGQEESEDSDGHPKVARLATKSTSSTISQSFSGIVPYALS